MFNFLDLRSEDRPVMNASRRRWIINSRGYANVVPSEEDIVYGMLYTLNTVDEMVLDGYEGVPRDYKKQVIPIEYTGMHEHGVIIKDGLKIIDALVYVDDLRMTPDVVRAEYIVRMNYAIQDAITHGIPEEYIDTYLRKDIPLGVVMGAGLT